MGLQFLLEVERRLIPRVKREGMVIQKYRGVERSTRMEMSPRMEQRTYFGQSYGQTSEKSRIDLGES